MNILPSGKVTLEVSITPGSGQFEVCENGALVVSGRIYVPNEPVLEIPIYERSHLSEENEWLQLTTNDIYKELRLRGYDYGPTFQGILSASNNGEKDIIYVLLVLSALICAYCRSQCQRNINADTNLDLFSQSN